MDYMYGELNDLVKNINYEGKTTNTANTVVDNINRTIKVDVNFEGIDYTALWTDTARMNQDQSARTYSVDVVKVPNDLNFVANTVNAEEKIFNGSEHLDIDLRPLVFADSSETEFVSENTRQLFRKNDQSNLYYIDREGIPPVTLTVQNTVNNNSEINADRIIGSLNPKLEAESLIEYAEETKLYSNKGFTITQSDESEYEINAFRLGSSSAEGSLTLHFKSPVTGITVNASIYCTTSGNYDKSTDLYINDIPVGVGNLFEEFTVNFDEPTDTVTFENRKTSSNAGRIWIDKFITLPGSDRYVPVNLVSMKNGVIEALEEDYNAITIKGGMASLIDSDGNGFQAGPDMNYIRGGVEISNAMYLNEEGIRVYTDNSNNRVVEVGDSINKTIISKNSIALTDRDIAYIKIDTDGIGLYNPNSDDYDYIRPGTDGGDFGCITIGELGSYILRTELITSAGSAEHGLLVPETHNWTANKTLTAEEDLENIFTPEADFTVDVQHFYKVGKMVFGHIVLYRNSAVSSTGIYKIGTCSKHAQHEHLFTAICFNGSVANSDAAILKTTGELDLRLTGTTSASTYKWDLSFFFCEEN